MLAVTARLSLRFAADVHVADDANHLEAMRPVSGGVHNPAKHSRRPAVERVKVGVEGPE